MRAWSVLGLGAALCTLGGAQRLPHALTKRIFGGVQAASHEYPFAVYVSSPASTNNTACAGAILTNQIIVTAALCVYDYNTKSAISAGSVSIGFGNSDRGAQPQVKVKKIIVPSTYNPSTGIDNIALIQVDLIKAISNSTNRIPVYAGDALNGDSLVAMGWGMSRPGDSASANVLQSVNVT
ncbi:hypothetical protein IWQ56_006061, partial [Coemansia nantahalensis]